MATENLQAIIDAAKNYGEAQAIQATRGDKETVPLLAVPAGRTVISIKKLLDEYLPAPERRIGTATVTNTKSFVDLVNRFKDAESAIFAVNDSKSPRLVAVLDYHPAESRKPGEARFGQHRVDYAFPVSPEWAAWLGSNGLEMNQAAFAQFLEDRIMDIGNPADALSTAKEFAGQLGITLASPQRLMELSRGLSIRVSARFKQAVKLSSGEAQMGFEETHEDEAGAPIQIPGGFAIRIPVFRDGDAFEIPARLKYRPAGGAVLWSYALQRVERVWDLVISEACRQVEEQTELPLYFGSPEK